MKYLELNLSKNGIVKILERDKETVIYQGKAKKATNIPNEEVLSINEVGGITEIVLDYGKTKEEKAEAKKQSKLAMKRLKTQMAVLGALACGTNGFDWRE